MNRQLRLSSPLALYFVVVRAVALMQFKFPLGVFMSRHRKCRSEAEAGLVLNL
jgi:hypothetical protein